MTAKFYVNDIRYDVIGITVKNEVSGFSTFSAILPAPSAAQIAAIGAGGHLYPNHYVKIVERGGSKETIFEGFLEKVTPGVDTSYKLEGRDAKVLLLDERTGRNEQWINQTGATIISGLLSRSTKVTAGSISFTEVVPGTFRKDHENLISSVSSLCNIMGKRAWISRSGSSFLLNIADLAVTTAATVTLRAGRELETAISRTATRDVINRICVFGAGDGINQIRVCVPWKNVGDADSPRCIGFGGYNADCLHAGATASQAAVGIMEGSPLVDTSIKSLDTAVQTANAILDAYASDTRVLKAKSIRYINGIQIGDVIRVIDTKKGVDETARALSIRRDFDKGVIEIELLNKDSTMSQELAQVRRNSDLSNISGLGATNFIPILLHENCGPNSGEELNIQFRLPADIVYIDAVKLSFRLENFRAYSQGSVASGVHAHSLSLWNPNDGYTTYPLGIENRGGVGTLICAPGAPGASTSEVSSSHFHDIEYGIYEEILVSPSVVVTAGELGSETAVNTYTSHQTDLDLTGNFSVSGGWANIKIVPNKNMRIIAFLTVKFYVESV
jgi:hypothetical protein